MAKRRSTYRVSSEEVQGEGSFVVLRAVPYKVAREALSLRGDSAGVSLVEAEQYVRSLIASSIVEWDWVDDDDNLLPVPEGDNLDSLLSLEVKFLTEELLGTLGGTKN